MSVLSEVCDEQTRRSKVILFELNDLSEERNILRRREAYRRHRSLGWPRVRVKKPKE